MAAERFELKLSDTGQLIRGLSADEVLCLLEARIASPDSLVRNQDGNGRWEQLARWAARRQPAPPVRRVRAGSMPPLEQRRRDGAQDDDQLQLELTPMIDVVFQLLIFFMLTGYYATAPRAELPRAVAGEATAIEGKIVIDLVPSAGAPKLWLDELPEPITLEQLPDKLARRMAESGVRQVFLRADRNAEIGVVRRVLKIATDVGADTTVIGVHGTRQ